MCIDDLRMFAHRCTLILLQNLLAHSAYTCNGGASPGITTPICAKKLARQKGMLIGGTRSSRYVSLRDSHSWEATLDAAEPDNVTLPRVKGEGKSLD